MNIKELQKRRIKLGLHQQDIAKKLNCGADTIDYYEQGLLPATERTLQLYNDFLVEVAKRKGIRPCQ
ncbi:MAG: helix-turn-helix transcriptional regulator [Synergistaceae bacterium]|nr:helix-turn-helix transcriptional regulator [Synergistaceae bacterium]